MDDRLLTEKCNERIVGCNMAILFINSELKFNTYNAKLITLTNYQHW